MIPIKVRSFITITIDGVERLISEIPDGSLTLEEYKLVRTNTDGFRAVLPKLNNEALKYVAQHYVANASRHPRVTYDYAINEDVIPELLKRL
jgi:hypothetical protein